MDLFCLLIPAFSFFGFGGMTGEVLFGIKVIALVILYGYMHMNLGGGILSTAVFLIFGYYILFHANGMLSVLILAVMFLMVHGFDILWGGDIVKANIGERIAAREAMRAPMYHQHIPP